MYKICFYVPEKSLETVKTALFKAGAGKVGLYDCCAWQVKGLGQFRALEGSQPFIGTVNALEVINEYRVELVCEASVIKEAIKALLEAHPYEEPAYDVMQVFTIEL
ncbi:MAG: hypothetical protein ISEC1_P0132 [Thiomicrorhabdus sp.]|nr:MAG: hypothetical protein ISEC1_P0132 [Thiomicrorhabdus sp.]